MYQKTFVAFVGCAPILVCTVVPTIIFSMACGQWGTNLIWGLIFGFGWWAAQTIGGPDHWLAASAFGLWVWAPLVVLTMFALSRRIWNSGNDRARRVYLLILAVSYFPIVPAETAASIYSSARVPPDINLLMSSW